MAGLQLQSVLARALDDDNLALMLSLELSAAFAIVNVRLWLKCINFLGLPKDLVSPFVAIGCQLDFYISCGR